MQSVSPRRVFQYVHCESERRTLSPNARGQNSSKPLKTGMRKRTKGARDRVLLLVDCHATRRLSPAAIYAAAPKLAPGTVTCCAALVSKPVGKRKIHFPISVERFRSINSSPRRKVAHENVHGRPASCQAASSPERPEGGGL